MMNNWPDNPAKRNGDGEMNDQRPWANAAASLDAESLIELARKHYATANPNPDRQDCPDREHLQSLARAGHIPVAHLCEHLFGCSDCFNAFRTAMLARAAVTPKHSGSSQ